MSGTEGPAAITSVARLSVSDASRWFSRASRGREGTSWVWRLGNDVREFVLEMSVTPALKRIGGGAERDMPIGSRLRSGQVVEVAVVAEPVAVGDLSVGIPEH